MTLHEIDRAISLWMNDGSGDRQAQDMIVSLVAQNDVFKGAILMMLFFGLWFKAKRRDGDERTVLIATLLASVVAIFAGRALALTLPFRSRPLHSSDPDVNVPFGYEPGVGLADWSSMPSDHAVLFFALATGIFLANRVAGALALLHAALVVSAPRIVLGLHYFGDIVIGAAIGAAIALAMVPPFRRLVGRARVIGFEASHPQFFYPALFLICFQCASMFSSARQAASVAVKIAGLGF